jgi:lipopolysaccharide cholinephosphotransferase
MANIFYEFLENLKNRDGQQYDKDTGACFDLTSYKVCKQNNEIIDTHFVHALLLKLILEFDRICRKNNIDYALAFGSALGIYNYKGFIPWDDDADIAIKYEDINRLVEALKKDLSDEYVFDCYENDKDYNVLIPTMKLRYKNSYVKEFNHLTLPNRCHNGDGIFIDICAFMFVPDNKKEHKKLIGFSKRKVAGYLFKDLILRRQPYKTKQKIKDYEKEIFDRYNNKTNSVAQTVIIPWQDFKMPLSAISAPKDVIFPFKEYDFEGHKLYSFNNIEEFCKIWFGEKGLKKFENGCWINPYPKSKRKLGHIRKLKYPLN